MDYYKGNLASIETAGLLHKMPFSLPYRRHAHPPFWQAQSSQANFCEEDYIITAYIAEFVNTLTNLTYIFYAYHGIKNNSKRPDAILRNLPYLGIAGVGLGSGIFHATMKNYTQWADDLSMLVATATVLHRVFTFDKSLTYTVVHGAILTSIMVAFSIWHCVTDELIMHSVTFGIMIVIVGVKTRSIIKARVIDPIVQQDVQFLTTWGAVIFVTGFAIWNVDNAICNTLTAVKRSIGLPWSFALELHGWWHIFTGLGAYIFIALVEYLTSEEAGQPLGSRFAWPVGYIITGNGSTSLPNVNGDLKDTNGLAVNANGALEHDNGNESFEHVTCGLGVTEANGKVGQKKNC